MVLDILIVFIIIFWLFNFLIADRDLLSPSCVFCMVIFGSLMMCVISQKDYTFELHWNTFLVIALGVIIFTVVSGFSYTTRNCKMSSNVVCKNYSFERITIPKTILALFVFIELLVGYFAIKYIIDVAIASTGGFSSLSIAIGIYDNLQKFDLNGLQDLNVSKHLIYSLGWPLLTAVSYILIYIVVHNFIMCKRMEKIPCIIIGIFFALTFLSGGRTYAFRVITAFVALSYYFRCIKYGFHKKQLGFIFKMIFVAIAVVAFFMIMRQALGRSISDYKWYQTMFSYFGAPIVNLDHYLETGMFPSSKLFGQESLYGIYNYLGNRFNIAEYIYSLDLPFVYYTGRNTGNVYTMFYQFIHDFGYLGIVPLTCIIAIFYNNIYISLKREVYKHNAISFKLLIYAYLFNDLVMLMFSNKFYETVVAINFLRFLIWVFIIWKVLFVYDLNLSKSKIQIRKKKHSMRNQLAD